AKVLPITVRPNVRKSSPAQKIKGLSVGTPLVGDKPKTSPTFLETSAAAIINPPPGLSSSSPFPFSPPLPGFSSLGFSGSPSPGTTTLQQGTSTLPKFIFSF